MHLDIHAHCNSANPELIRKYVESCEKMRPWQRFSAGCVMEGMILSRMMML